MDLFCLAVLTVLAFSSPSCGRELDVRLVNGTTASEGRLEVMFQGEWGTVCSQDFKIEEATVACRQLGYGYAEAVREFGQGTKKVVRMMNCNGNEGRLSECYYDFGKVVCGGFSDVGVVCTNTPVPVTTTAPGDDGSIFRLAGGATPYEGRVEAISSRLGAWTPVCWLEWNFEKAELFCKELGYRPATSTTRMVYDEASGPVAVCLIHDSLEYVFCGALDTSKEGVSCNHTINVVCSGSEPGVQGEIRIVNGSTVVEGRVETFDRNTWKSLCADDWGIEEVRAVCQQLGLHQPSPEVVPPGGTFGGNEESLQENITCTGKENCLKSCSWTPKTSCAVANAAAQCGSVSEADMTDLRLVNGGSSAEGRVEMLFEGEWVAVCPTDFHLVEATVVCRQLGFLFAESLEASYGDGTVTKGFILNCNGDEETISQCYRSDEYCQLLPNLGVTCSNGDPDFPLTSLHCNTKVQNGDLRLVGGPDPYRGRVEVFISSVEAWATFCAEDWNYKLAKVVCRVLNYRPATWTGKSRYGEGTGPISDCERYEDWIFYPNHCSVLNTSSPTTTCDHSMDIGVHCDGIDQGEEEQLRLANGTERTEGRVEIFDKGQWKAMCADGLGLEEAQAMCRQLGMPPPSTTLPGGSFGGNDTLEMLGETFNCTEHQQNLGSCTRSFKSALCMVEDPAVQCGTWKDAKEGDLRLTGGPTNTYGQLQVFHDGQWGVVCRRDGWDEWSAHVACRDLGYAGVLHKLAYYTANDPELPVWESSMNCYGNESSFADCGTVLGEGSSCEGLFALAVCDTRPKSDANGVRVAGGPYPNQGRVEVLFGEVWGTICKSKWDLNGANVVCRQLGFKSAAFALDDLSGIYEKGQQEVIFYQMDCGGWEDNLVGCRFKLTGPDYRTCYGNRIVGVVCSSDEYPSEDPRLIQDSTTAPPTRTVDTLQVVWIVLLVLSVLCSAIGGCLAYNKRKSNRNVGNQDAAGNEPANQTSM